MGTDSSLVLHSLQSMATLTRLMCGTPLQAALGFAVGDQPLQ